MECKMKLLSSLEKVFFFDYDALPEWNSGSMFKNEIFSFQVMCWAEGFYNNVQRLYGRIQIESELEPYIQVKRIDYVPAINAVYTEGSDDDYITKTPGLFPDPLQSIDENGKIELANRQTRAFWIAVEPQSKMTGTYPITIRIFDEQDKLAAEACFTLEIIDAELPELDIYNTGWIHGDCLATLHGVEVLSEEYWSILEKYLRVYVKFGHNMILTPVLTPPLDTVEGGERPTNQLVEVTVVNGNYSFGFDNLKRWIVLCQKCGIKYFEICHLFTQWGAKHAPKVMATVDGIYQKIFGWETDALGEEYKAFLHAFLEELVKFLKVEGILQDCRFHVSDEPKAEDIERYRAAKEILLAHVDESQTMDALSNYSFYETGIVSHPVVGSTHIQPFLNNKVEDLCAYYCMAQADKVANRFMAMPSYRNRILGYQLYKYNIKGFLQWGFNFWYQQLSVGPLNPYQDTSAGGGFPSGDSFVVYPLDQKGEVVCSLRLYVFNEALQDMRALKLLESLTSRELTIRLLEDLEGFTTYPRNSEYILMLRKRINEEIQSVIGKLA